MREQRGVQQQSAVGNQGESRIERRRKHYGLHEGQRAQRCPLLFDQAISNRMERLCQEEAVCM